MKKIFAIIFLFTVLAYGCKKKQQSKVETEDQQPSSPAPKGKLGGTWKWISGDSATADLNLTTGDLNYLLIPSYIHVDRYVPNIMMFCNNGSGEYYQTMANYNTDTIKIFLNLKHYRYIRK